MGINNGLNGADVIEGFVPLAVLGVGPIVRVAVVAVGGDGAGALVSRDGEVGGPAMWLRLSLPAPAPVATRAGLAACVLLLCGVGVWALRRRGPVRALLVLLGLAGTATIAWAVTIIVDGQVNDWTGIPPLGVGQACGSGGDAATEIAALFATADAANLYLRLDVCDLVVPALTPTASPTATGTPTGTATPTPTATPTSTPTATACSGFVDQGNGTVLDCTTNLVWEKKSDDNTLHDKDFYYAWAGTCADGGAYCQPSAAAAAACAAGTGSASTVGCAQCVSGACNCAGAACNTNGANPGPGSGNYSTIWQWLTWLNGGSGFAGATDWRIPKVNQSGTPAAAELETILRAPYPCTGYTDPCTWPAFNSSCTAGSTVLTGSCTQSGGYWSATTYAGNSYNAWYVSFYSGFVSHNDKAGNYYVRAVRGGS